MLSTLLAGAGHWIAGHQEAFVSAFGLVLAIIAWALDHRLRRRRLLYRVQMDTALHLAPGIMPSGADIVVRVNGREVTDPSVALIRVTNTGSLPIHQEDFLRPLSFTFAGRTVVGYEVAENDEVASRLTTKPPAPPKPSPHQPFWNRLTRLLFGSAQPTRTGTPSSAEATDQDRLVLPAFELEQRERFKLLVVLSGGGRGVEAKGTLRNGKLVRDLGGNGPSRRTIVYGAIVAVLVGAFVVAVTFRPVAPPSNTAFRCVSGQLTVVGSTAFMPAVVEIAHDYQRACVGATITVNGTGSIAGITELETSRRPDEVAFYDGSAPVGVYPDLVGHHVAAVVFAVVVNGNTDVHNLTINQLRDIFAGRATNWNQLNPSLPHLPITVVGRDSESGTRAVFTSGVLGGADEHDRTSQNCSSLDPGQPPSAPIVCEMPNTDLVLQKINSIFGAIGYAEISASSAFPNLYRIQIQNHDPDVLQDKQDAYPFWATEHAYTNGQPAQNSLLAAFLEFMNNKIEYDAMHKNGAIPCADLGQTPGQIACSE